MPIQGSWIASGGTLYAGSFQTLYKSLDQGVTWQPLITFIGSTPVEIDRVYVNELNYIFVSPNSSATANELGLWRSINHGQTWSQVLALPLSCNIWAMAEDSNGNLFAGVYTTGSSESNARIYRSTDGGATWVSVYYNSSARHIHCIAVDGTDNYVYASVGDELGPWNINYIIRSTDGGNTWTQILSGIPQIIAIVCVPGARLFAADAATDGEIYRTTNDVSFTSVLDTGVQSYGYWMRTNDLNGNIYASFVGGENPAHYVAGIWMSTNNGLSWTVYKTFNIHNAYLGSCTTSNFFQGTMYYDLELDNGWQNGTKIYPDALYNNIDTAPADSLSQLSSSIAQWVPLALVSIAVSNIVSLKILAFRTKKKKPKTKNKINYPLEL